MNAACRPDVAVVIVSYNVRALLDACLASVRRSLSLTPGLRADVWVVDNGSTDGSAELIQSRYPEARLLTGHGNIGFSAANNLAIERTNARHLLLLNPDTEVRDDTIGHLVSFMDAHPRAGVAGCRLVYPDGSFQHSHFAFPSLLQVVLDLYPVHHRLTESRWNGRSPRRAYDLVREVGHPLGACFVVRREVVNQVGAFDEDYFMYCEEIDWCWRIRRAGWRIYHTPGATVVHHGGQSTGQRRGPMLVALHRSRLRFFERQYGRTFAWLARTLVRRRFAAAAAAARRAPAADDDELSDRQEWLTTYATLASI